ncbi:WecB/TagA/CpsF family glycosyltransferase [Ensifer canadensis]
MHLVLFSSLVPVDNPASGFDIANRAVLDGLLALGHRVSVVGFLQPGRKPAPGCEMHLLGELEVTNAKVGRLQKLNWLAAAFLNRTSVSSAKMLVVSAGRIQSILDGLAPFDGLVLNSVQLPAAFAQVFRPYPSIYVAHNVEASSALENAERAKGAFERYLFRREASYLERYEQQLAQNAVALWTFAEADRLGFGRAVADRAFVLPLVTGWDAPILPEVQRQHDLGLIGTWSWRPNRLGLDWFLDQVVPHLPTDMSIAIAGHLDGTPIVSHPGIRFVGRVPDARAFVAASAIVPLISRGGTGVQLKTIETFELGMPSVATQASLRGIDMVPANCIATDDPAEFARLLVEKVGRARTGVSQRLNGSLFHQAQQTRMMQVMRDVLPDLAAGGDNGRGGKAVATPIDRSRRRAMMTGAVTASNAALSQRLILGIPVADPGWANAFAFASEVAARPTGQIRLAFLNANNANLMMKDAEYRDVLQRQVVLPDGYGVDIASYLFHGDMFPANLNGTDFVPALLTYIDRPMRIAMIGARPDVLLRATDNFRKHAPWHEFRPVSDGFFDRSRSREILADVRAWKADILVVAMGSPMQEKWVDAHVGPQDARLVITVGALFDFVAQEFPRAPKLLRRLRLEWFYRLAMEPKRMWRRYILGNPLFLLHVFLHKLTGRARMSVGEAGPGARKY